VLNFVDNSWTKKNIWIASGYRLRNDALRKPETEN